MEPSSLGRPLHTSEVIGNDVVGCRLTYADTSLMLLSVPGLCLSVSTWTCFPHFPAALFVRFLRTKCRPMVLTHCTLNEITLRRCYYTKSDMPMRSLKELSPTVLTPLRSLKVLSPTVLTPLRSLKMLSPTVLTPWRSLKVLPPTVLTPWRF